MVHTTCAVRDCMSSSRINKDIRFHQIPRTENRCKLWVKACRRPDLLEKSVEELKNIYICSLHFENGMYGKKSLKKTALPTLLLPTKDYIPLRDCSSQTPARLTCNKLKNTTGKDKDITEELFLRSCDKFLSLKLSKIVKTQLYLKSHCKNNRYSRELKKICLNIYNTSPLAYRFLSKTICLPSKSNLAMIYLPMETKLNQQVWDILTATMEHMSPSQKQCVLCMDKMSLKLNLFYNTKEDKILGLHEVDGQKQQVSAGYAFTLMLRGITSNWKQPIGFSFISSSKIDDQLKTWIIVTAKRLLQLGFNVRAFVSDLGSDFLAFSKTLGISKESSCFQIDSHKIYYIFDVPHLMKCIRNNLLNYNYEFDNNIARWEDIKTMYEHDKIKDMRLAPRLTDSHIQPNSFQKQKVRFAVQVFSNSVVAALNNYQSSGTIQIANGTIHFIETMNNLFDVLNSNNIDSPQPYNKSYRGTTVQEELLDKSLLLFNSMKVKNKNNGRDVTKIVKFIKAINITINSIRKLYNDMRSEGYDYILTRRVNNDCLKNFFDLVRQAVVNCRKPTCIQYTRAFRKFFICQILNLSDATNCTEDFDSILTQFVEFSKSIAQSPVSVQDPPQTSQLCRTKEYDIPEKNAFHYFCGYLLRRCVESHKRDCLSIVYLYIHLKAYSTSRDRFGELLVPPCDFVDYIRKLETKLISIFSFTENHVGHKLFEHLSLIEFNNKPCACFPVNFLIKLFIRMRIFYIIKSNNRNFKCIESRNPKYLSVTHL